MKKVSTKNKVAIVIFVFIMGFLAVWVRNEFKNIDRMILDSRQKGEKYKNDIRKSKEEFAALTAKPKLVLLSWRWSHKHGFAIAEGEVKNISSENLRNVTAVATFYTAAGDFITSEFAIIGYNPILPGQTSPFEVIATYNPEMRKVTINFKDLMGGTIRWQKNE